MFPCLARLTICFSIPNAAGCTRLVERWGVVVVVAQLDADHYEVVESVTTAPGAATSLFEPVAGKLYVAIPGADKQRPAIQVYQALPVDAVA